ncbi:hypothetical protein [Acanthopleuribacter pedis]|uniref:Uncharacterized protein n=1 Tax=Acanthopleuribacter pedis TaxID=442870 RepID=A0A8J7QEB4_9BACT|nr:hypothetical protein [Acanthopleuribacter pedis]MBO1322309.1 hypothetical protein [Acanthopleuribacter pedis]
MNIIQPMQTFKKISFSCINGNSLDLISEFEEIFSLSRSKGWEIKTEKTLDLKSLYHPAPKSGGAHLPEFLLWSPEQRKDTSVFFSNYIDGLSGTIKALTGCFERHSYSAHVSAPEDDFPYFSFQFFSEGAVERVVYAMKDDPKWEFFQKGELLPIEDASSYRKREIRNRLTEEIIASYFKKLGWDISLESFWASSGSPMRFSKTEWD